MRMRRGFTLIEVLISISILSVVMIFLYKSYASLNHSNAFYKQEAERIQTQELLKKVLFLDLSLASSLKIQNQSPKEDVVVMQTSNSLHKRYDPYVTYFIKNKKLYRLESLKELSYPIPAESQFSVDLLGEAKIFRLYKSQPKAQSKSEQSPIELYLLHLHLKENEPIFFKVKLLNTPNSTLP